MATDHITTNKHIDSFIVKISPVLKEYINNPSNKSAQFLIQNLLCITTNLPNQYKILDNTADGKICNYCFSQSFVTDEQIAQVICTNCGKLSVLLSSQKFEQGNVHKNRKRSVNYNRTTLYIMYLQNFTQESLNIPKHIYNDVLRYTRNEHLQHPLKLKNTPVCNALKKLGHFDYVKYSTRIAKTINKESIPNIPDEIIQCLVNRFKILIQIFKQYRHEFDGTSKFINFEFLTKQFLHMEHAGSDYDCNAMAYKLSLHKTHQVLIRAEERLEYYCGLINQDKNISGKIGFKPWQITQYR